MKSKPDENKFDAILSESLGSWQVDVPAGFIERTANRLADMQRQQILAKAVLQERLAIAGCVLLPMLAILVVWLFPAVPSFFAGLVEIFTRGICQATGFLGHGWQLWAGTCLAVGVLVYSLVDILAEGS